MTHRVYLSSTLDDLRPYRAAAAEALRKAGYLVIDSYAATPNPTVEQCQADVRSSDIYVGIFAGRYGWQPDGHGGKSITELEYRAVPPGRPRFIFMRDLKKCSGEELDNVLGNDDAYARLKSLREELQDGNKHTCMLITDPTDLALKITQALLLATQPGGIFTEPPPHPRQLSCGLLIVGAKGCDDDAVRRIAAQLPPSWQAATALFNPDAPDIAAERLALDEALARARCVALHLSPIGLARLRDKPAVADGLVRMLAGRLDSYAVLAEAPVTADGLPATWPRPAALFPIGEWLAAPTDTYAGQLVELVTKFPLAAPTHQDVMEPRLVGLAYSVIAMTRSEADALVSKPSAVQDELGRKSYDFFASITGNGTDGAGWAARYGEARDAWKPFGTHSIRTLLQDVINDINQQEVVSRRDQSALRNNRIRLRYYPFEPAAFKPGSPDWPLLERMRARGCLILVDELSAYHPMLHGSGNVFLSDPAVTVATLSSLDPPHFSLDAQIDSPQKIDVLIDRFTTKLDPRCELALNNASRMRRWLRLSVPEALAGNEARGADPDLRSAFRSNPSGR